MKEKDKLEILVFYLNFQYFEMR